MAQVDWVEQSESGNWNIAASFCEQKISKPLFEADEYMKMALYGTATIQEEFMTNENIKTLARIKSLRRLIDTLLLVIGNSKFAMRKQTDKDELLKFEKNLKILKNHISNTFQVRTFNSKPSTHVIDENKFDLVIERVTEIKNKMLEPLNRAELIFRNTEAFDPKTIKQKIKEQLTSIG
jgi:ribosomal protein L17